MTRRRTRREKQKAKARQDRRRARKVAARLLGTPTRVGSAAGDYITITTKEPMYGFKGIPWRGAPTLDHETIYVFSAKLIADNPRSCGVIEGITD